MKGPVESFTSPDSDEPLRRGHILLIYYFFPPATGGGVPRPVKMAKYLRRLGWKVTVLTVAAPGEVDPRLEVEPEVSVLRVDEWDTRLPLRLADRLTRAGRRAWERFDRRGDLPGPSLLDSGFAEEEREIEASKIGWVGPGTRAALALHRRHPVDVAVVSSPPASSGTIAVLLRLTRGIPFVVEYRDPWTVDPFWARGPEGDLRADPVTLLRMSLARRMESALLDRATGAIIVNGENHIKLLRAKFPRQTEGKPVAHIPNGVDLEDMAAFTQSAAKDSRPAILRLVHTGFFYHFHTPYQLIAALHMILGENPEILQGVEVEFIGDGFPDALAREAERWGLGPHLKVTRVTQFSGSLRAIHEADGLIIILPPLASDDDRIPTKLYEYLATSNPILAVANGQGATASLLATVPGAVVADNRDVQAIAEAMVLFINLVRHRRVTGPPLECLHRAEEHHYAARAAQLDKFVRDAHRQATPIPRR